jgi:hypothetical protein
LLRGGFKLVLDGRLELLVERDCLLKPECGFKDNFLAFFEIVSGDELLVGEIVIYALF